MVCPSGSALATAPTPSVPPAPTRFSTTIGWPSCAESCSATVRATMSVPLPAVNGMMIRIGFDGQVCAVAPARPISTAATTFKA